MIDMDPLFQRSTPNQDSTRPLTGTFNDAAKNLLSQLQPGVALANTTAQIHQNEMHNLQPDEILGTLNEAIYTQAQAQAQVQVQAPVALNETASTSDVTPLKPSNATTKPTMSNLKAKQSNTTTNANTNTNSNTNSNVSALGASPRTSPTPGSGANNNNASATFKKLSQVTPLKPLAVPVPVVDGSSTAQASKPQTQGNGHAVGAPTPTEAHSASNPAVSQTHSLNELAISSGQNATSTASMPLSTQVLTEALHCQELGEHLSAANRVFEQLVQCHPRFQNATIVSTWKKFLADLKGECETLAIGLPDIGGKASTQPPCFVTITPNGGIHNGRVIVRNSSKLKIDVTSSVNADIIKCSIASRHGKPIILTDKQPMPQPQPRVQQWRYYHQFVKNGEYTLNVQWSNGITRQVGVRVYCNSQLQKYLNRQKDSNGVMSPPGTPLTPSTANGGHGTPMTPGTVSALGTPGASPVVTTNHATSPATVPQ
eukprot:GFYU01002094.1.p1 GENE.GFYU01002094.1~~GFYU01002094.1.p1  ORF type:complete len:485 (-),score=105.54 GFYU01002094.1:167-1621(-)